MRILLIHNQYKQSGGEDAVFRAEGDLLLQNGHDVATMLYDNTVIESLYDQVLSGLKALYNIGSAQDIGMKIQSFKPDVIHVHNFLPLVSPSVFFVAKRWKIPIVLTLHNYRLICPSATLFHQDKIYERSLNSVFPFDAISRGVYRNSRLQTAVVALMTGAHHMIGTWRKRIDCYIALTQFAKNKFLNSRLGIDRSKLIVKPNFTTDYGFDLTEREPYFLFIGRLTEEKGIRTLLKATELLNFKLIIIGDGPLQRLVEESAKTNLNISYIGFVAKQIVMNYLKRCKALIFPSVWYEGFPVTIVEAFSTATPVIASDLGSMSEIIQHEINGLHFTPGDENDLITKMKQLIQNPGLAAQLSINARSSYENLYTPQQNYRLLIGIYTRVIQAQKYTRPPFQWYSLTQSKHW